MKPTLLALCAPAILSAGTPVVPPPDPVPAASGDNGWHYRFALYGWATSLDGEVAVAGNFAPVDVSFSDIWDNLDMAAMGVFEVSRGPWNVLLDVNYSELSANIPFVIGPDSSFIRYEQEMLLAHLVGGYRLIGSEALRLDLYGGARATWMDVELGRGTHAVTLSGDQSWVDPIVGFRGQARLSDSFYLRALGDVGGFGVASDLTWQAMAGIGWQFSDHGGLFLGYRMIGTDYHDGGFAYDVKMHGPILGMELAF